MAAKPVATGGILHGTKFTLIFLTLEFISGMVINLLVVSKDDPGYALEPFYIKFASPVHELLGTILLIGSIALLYSAFKAGHTLYKKLAGLGLLFVLIAFAAGMATYKFEGYQSELASFVMSLGFIASFLSYGTLYLHLKK